jgi:hypothetical protein
MLQICRQVCCNIWPLLLDELPYLWLTPNYRHLIIQVNDSVWELYSPSRMPAVEIIFFHGLQMGDYENAFWKTWRAEDEKAHKNVLWPRDWLSQIVPNARMFSISYNSSATRPDVQPDMYALGENLVDDIILDKKRNIGQNCPVILVGHSLGGLVIKQFVLSAMAAKDGGHSDAEKERVDHFLENLKGVFFYATPHSGSEKADLASTIKNTNPILELLKTLNNDIARINSEFTQHRKNLGVRTGCIAECQPVTIMVSPHYLGSISFIWLF